jgi:hypothetical protein
MSSHPAARPTGTPSRQARRRAASPTTEPRTGAAALRARRAGHVPSRLAAADTAAITGTTSHACSKAADIIPSTEPQAVSAPRLARGTNFNGHSKPKSAGRTLACIFLHGLKTQ